MSKNSGMGSKRMGSHTNKGMGKCSSKNSKQCGNAMDYKELDILFPPDPEHQHRHFHKEEHKAEHQAEHKHKHHHHKK